MGGDVIGVSSFSIEWVWSANITNNSFVVDTGLVRAAHLQNWPPIQKASSLLNDIDPVISLPVTSNELPDGSEGDPSLRGVVSVELDTSILEIS